jgi:hypothetical protein
MSFKHVRTAGDLARFKCALKVECERCMNAVTLTGFDVAKVIGTQDFRHLQRRLKCSLCGVKEARLTVLTPDPPRN